MHGSAPVLDSPGLQRFGFPELVKVPNPAAGATYTYTVTGEYAVRFVAVYCKFVADANAASREITVEYRDDGTQRFALSGINTTVTATNTAYYAFNAFQPAAVATVDSTALVPLMPILLMPTWSMKLNVLNVQAGDQLSQIRLVIERFYTTAPPGLDGPKPPAA